PHGRILRLDKPVLRFPILSRLMAPERLESVRFARVVWWRLAVVGVAVAAAFVPVSASIVDRGYSAGIYPSVQRFLTSASNLTPIALLAVLIGVVAAVALWMLVRDASRYGAAWTVARAAARFVVLGAAVYLAFLGAWGFNYRRVPLVQALPFD